ncbi:hypothetical protein [Dickeya chrysanthemi]|uniref:hypothetical protein n=1 Tax=Dickeya chrysanthemi TaxID=556 RepID=UPI0003A6ACDF|nr:hypothetical protein [Dickeya chrysanthemi]
MIPESEIDQSKVGGANGILNVDRDGQFEVNTDALHDEIQRAKREREGTGEYSGTTIDGTATHAPEKLDAPKESAPA